MKIVFKLLPGILMLLIGFACKKETALSSPVTASTSSMVINRIGTLGRQQIVLLPTGDFTIQQHKHFYGHLMPT